MSDADERRAEHFAWLNQLPTEKLMKYLQQRVQTQTFELEASARDSTDPSVRGAFARLEETRYLIERIKKGIQ